MLIYIYIYITPLLHWQVMFWRHFSWACKFTLKCLLVVTVQICLVIHFHKLLFIPSDASMNNYSCILYLTAYMCIVFRQWAMTTCFAFFMFQGSSLLVLLGKGISYIFSLCLPHILDINKSFYTELFVYSFRTLVSSTY